MSTLPSHTSASASWHDVPSDILERFVASRTALPGIFQLASICGESRCKAADMAQTLLQSLDSAELPQNLKPSPKESETRQDPCPLSALRQLLGGVPSEDGTSTVRLDPTNGLLFSVHSPSPASLSPPRPDPSHVGPPTLFIPRHLDTPAPFSRAVTDRGCEVLSRISPILHHFPSLSPSNTLRTRVRSLLQGATFTHSGHIISWDPSSDSLCFHVAAASLKCSPGQQVHTQASIPGSRFASSLHLDRASDFLSTLDIHFPFPVPEGQASVHWVTARSTGASAEQADKVFAQCEYPGDLYSTVNLSTAADNEGRVVTSVSTALSRSGRSDVWTWETVRAGKLRVKGKDGWAAKHQGEACVYGKGAQGLYLDCLLLKVQL